MNTLEAFWLGLVQGLTEFLPVSSSGHLVMLENLLGVEEEGLLFEVVVHVATLVSVLLFFRKRVTSLVVGALRGERDAWTYAGKLAVGTLPAVALVLLAGDFLEAQYSAPWVTGACLLATGAALWTTRFTLPRAEASEPTWSAALLIGCAQALAILPGISRSGATLTAGLALGVAPTAATEFSFLLGVVAIAGAAVRTLPELGAADPQALRALAVGAAAALVFGIAAIWLFVRLLRSQRFHFFAFYTWAVGAAFLAWLAL
ncbi:MAG: undecaprenyl-diphosphate phosphatase [Proteobacteria bacterium]|nr:undecaprenyl-diphosphate phosphatase [Pseudomonadota bacterium]